jgi:carotenoid cleavage dioxygenase-like enzyme
VTARSGFQAGFSTLEREIVVDRLPTRGTVPAWLKGTLLRNGPAQFEVGPNRFRHWFDGLAMLHRFSIAGGQVSYANRFLRSHPYRKAVETGRITYGEFATDPCRSLFNRVSNLFFPEPADNGLVNIARLAERFVALTESPLPVAFDPQTLETLGFPRYEGVGGHITTAHPHYDPAREAVVNYVTRISRTSSYNVHAIPRGTMRRTLIGSVKVEQPAYMHSFGMTESYVVLVEFPRFFDPIGLALKRGPYIANSRWRPEKGARFLVMDKRSGALAGTFQAEAFFAFHHVNAFEQGGAVVVDIAAYGDDAIIDKLLLDELKGPGGGRIPQPELRRYRLPRGGSSAQYEVLSDQAIDLPRIDYRRSNARDYRFAYGIGTRRDRPDDFIDQLVKVDVRERRARVWFEDGCYPGEPVFVAAPGATGEDDGVVLSVVLDAGRDISFLVILAAGSFEEVARAEVPHRIPFGLHGLFVEDPAMARARS